MLRSRRNLIGFTFGLLGLCWTLMACGPRAQVSSQLQADPPAVPAEAKESERPATPVQLQFSAEEREAYANAILEPLGGRATVRVLSIDAFGTPVDSLSGTQLRVFAFGQRLFDTNWVAAPASVKSFDGLGPLFIRDSCAGCHVRDGRGTLPDLAGQPLKSALLRLSEVNDTEKLGPHPTLGGQFQPAAVPGHTGEGELVVTFERSEYRFPDGTVQELQRPVAQVTPSLGRSLGPNTARSLRVAPAVHGMGLLAAVPVSELERLADPNDEDRDGISGRLNRVQSALEGPGAPGRFGWKAAHATVDDQAAAAAIGDMGISTPIHVVQNSQGESGEGDVADDELDLPQVSFDKLVFYLRALAVPARRDVERPEVVRGGLHFLELGCAACHQPTLQTASVPDIVDLSEQRIHPFTDLLLHDMGPDLADRHQEGDAAGAEWRTAPLWGIGMVETVNGHTRFLHDGRARNLTEAVLWHGGEAEEARERFAQLTAAERNELIAFLRSL